MLTSQQFPTSIGAQTSRRACHSATSARCPSSSRLRSVLRLYRAPRSCGRRPSQQFPTSIGAQTGRPRRARRPGPAGPSSSRLRSVLRQRSRAISRPQNVSQQFPTSIGAQTCNKSSRSLSPRSSPSSSRLRSVLRQATVHCPSSTSPVPAVPDFDRCSDYRSITTTPTPWKVPAVPDFDRCSDRPMPLSSETRIMRPSSSRLRSVLRLIRDIRKRVPDGSPSSSRLRSVLRHVDRRRDHRRGPGVPAVPDFDRCSDWRLSRWRCLRMAGPSSSRLRSVLRRQRPRARCPLLASVPAVPDFDRCSDPRGQQDTAPSCSGPSSSRLRSVLRPASTLMRKQVLQCRPSSSRLRSVLRPGRRARSSRGPESQQFPTSIGAQTPMRTRCVSMCSVPAVPDFDRCSDYRRAAGATPGRRVPAVPDFDRCSDSHNKTLRKLGHIGSQQFPTSIGAQTGGRSDRQRQVGQGSQQFPTSIGAQTGRQCGAGAALPVPAVPDFDRCSDIVEATYYVGGNWSGPSSSRLRSVLRLGSRSSHSWSGPVPAVPDFDRCSDEDRVRPEPYQRLVPAVPDFDRCSDDAHDRSALDALRSQQFPTSIGAQTLDSRAARAGQASPSSSRLRSVLRPRKWPASRSRVEPRPSSSRLRSVLRHVTDRCLTQRVNVPAVPDFDRCSDSTRRPTSSASGSPSSSRLRSVLRPAKGRQDDARNGVPAVPDFDRCSDSPSSCDRQPLDVSQQFPTSIGAQTRRTGRTLDGWHMCPSSSRLRSVLRPVGFARHIAVSFGSQQFPTSIGAQTTTCCGTHHSWL